jgi:hypothetical protein
MTLEIHATGPSLGPNPFHANVVHDVWQALPGDVQSIHQNVFDECLAALDCVSRGNSDTVVIYGPAGSGKTHLLSRLQHHLLAKTRGAPDGATHCMFVAVKLQTNAAQVWQHVRRRLAADLQRETQGVSQLQRLLAHQLAAARAERPSRWVRALRVLTGLQEESVTEHLNQLAVQLDLSRDLTVVLDHLVLGRQVHDARAWLRGESLPDAVLERLGLGLGREEHSDREQAAREVVSALCRLAGNTLPIVFCFDQIEAIQLHKDDRDALFRFGRMASELSESGNVLIISCLQSALVDELTQSIRQADRDRIFKRAAVLQPLSPPQVEALIKLRLDASPELAAFRRAHPTAPFYPFDAPTVRALAATSPCTPRRILARAAERFEQLRGKPPIVLSLDTFLTQAYEARRRTVVEDGGPEDSTVTLQHGIPMLWAVRGEAAAPVPAADAAQGIDALLPSAAGPLRVSVRNETNFTSLAASLRKLQAAADSGSVPYARLTMLRDARRPIAATAKRCHDYVSELTRGGARLIQVSAEALAALEALRELISDARSGDLSVKGEPVSEGFVNEWLARALDRPLVELTERIATGRGATES